MPASVEGQSKDSDANWLRSQLGEVLDQLENLADLATDGGFVAVLHKVEEAVGPLSNARDAAQQYVDGSLLVVQP